MNREKDPYFTDADRAKAHSIAMMEKVLRDRQDALAEAEAEANRAREARNRAVCKAVMRKGMTAYRVAQILGISPQAVSKIVAG